MAGDADAVEIAQGAGRIELTVKVVPGASRTRVAGVWGSALKLAVAAPPEGGQANAAVVGLLAAVLGVKQGAVAILSGHGRPVKRVAVSGLDAAKARVRLMRVL
jgi:uncharacterized protein YggU (UPF0235/DUF167 family)